MRTITLEEHFAPPGFLDGAGRQLKEAQLKLGARGEKIIAQLATASAASAADSRCTVSTSSACAGAASAAAMAVAPMSVATRE